MATAMETIALKLEIKQWEKDFKTKEGKNPTREDIKRDLAIASKYKLYQSSKKEDKREIVTPQKPREPLTPVKVINRQMYTPQKTSPAANSSSPTMPSSPQSKPIDASPQVDKLGPTPQLDGRVMSLFDAVRSPCVTPTKPKGNIGLITPTKKLDIQKALREEQRDEHEFKTPHKVVRTLTFDTPAYLKTGTVNVSFSPSPMAQLRLKKSMSTLFDELKDIEAELKYGDHDQEELIPLYEAEPSSEGEHEEASTWKKKGAKRQIRLVKKRARPMHEEEDEMKNKNIKEQLDKLSTVQETIESDESEEWSEGEREYIRQEITDTDTDTKSKKRKQPLNRNFKKLKLRNTKAKKFFGKRSRGW